MSPAVPKKTKRKKLPSLLALIKKADLVFSRFIRNRDKICCTCGQPAAQAGHFIKRSHKKIRWDVTNVHGQCVRCNHFLDGNESAYALFIVNKYGVEKLRWLNEQKGIYKPSREEVNKVIEAYS